MLPFLKNRDDGVGTGPVETKDRKPDDDSFDMLDAVAEDVMDAVKKGDKKALKDALAALVEHIQMQDVEQDEGMSGE